MANIWDVLERYAGLWVAVDHDWQVVGTGPELGELRERAENARTFVFACGENPAKR